jgi:hypothetical protein
MSIIRITTESGSVYEVDPTGHKFRKAQTTDESGVDEFPWRKYTEIRQGGYAQIGDPDENNYTPFEVVTPSKITVGRQLHFNGSRLWDWVRTSPVVKVTRIKSKGVAA